MIHKIVKYILIIYAFSFTSLIYAEGTANKVLYYWTEIGPDSTQLARAVVNGIQCPSVQIDNVIHPMQPRAPSSESFPLLICEVEIPKFAKKASFGDGNSFALLPKNLQKIVIIGDTGCRLKANKVQACNDPNKWPFAKIINQIATKEKPDLIIHLGDYYYREMTCPNNNKECANSPHGDNWITWQTEFFQPTAQLLNKAPWVMLRGNHEDCKRGHEGWMRFINPLAYNKTCQKEYKTYTVPLNNINLIVMDSSGIHDSDSAIEQLKLLDDYFKAPNTSHRNSWVLTHKPLWALEQSISPAKPSSDVMKNTLKDRVTAIFSGHVHSFQSINFLDKSMPAQVIVGNSGSSLYSAVHVPENAQIDGMNLDQFFTTSQFGYLSLEKSTLGWKAKLHNANGTVLATCKFTANTFKCASTKNEKRVAS